MGGGVDVAVLSVRAVVAWVAAVVAAAVTRGRRLLSLVGPAESLTVRPAAEKPSEPSSATGPRMSSLATGGSLTSVTVIEKIGRAPCRASAPLVVRYARRRWSERGRRIYVGGWAYSP